MADGIHVNSFRSLEELEAAISRFSSRFTEVIEHAERNIARKRQMVDDVVKERERIVSYWQREYDSADSEDDDVAAISHQLAEAEDELQGALQWQQRIEDSYAAYSSHCDRIMLLCTGDVQKAQTVLRRKIKDLYEYARMDSGSYNVPMGLAAQDRGLLDAPLVHAENVPESGGRTTESSVHAFSSFLLPRGFQWIPLDRVDPLDLEELPNDEEFKKMRKDDMAAGMELLRSRILRDIQRNPNAIGSDYFWEIDQQEGRTGVNSLRNVYDAYFGGERIRLEPSNRDGYYRIDHGRHRIKLARELGWTMIPVSLRPTTYGRR